MQCYWFCYRSTSTNRHFYSICEKEYIQTGSLLTFCKSIKLMLAYYRRRLMPTFYVLLTCWILCSLLEIIYIQSNTTQVQIRSLTRLKYYKMGNCADEHSPTQTPIQIWIHLKYLDLTKQTTKFKSILNLVTLATTIHK